MLAFCLCIIHCQRNISHAICGDEPIKCFHHCSAIHGMMMSKLFNSHCNLTQRYRVPFFDEFSQQFLVVFIRCGTSLMKYTNFVGSYIFLTLYTMPLRVPSLVLWFCTNLRLGFPPSHTRQITCIPISIRRRTAPQIISCSCSPVKSTNLTIHLQDMIWLHICITAIS